MSYLETKRLIMIPLKLDYVEAALKGKEKLETMLGYRIADEWPNPEYAEVLSFIVEQLREKPELSEWSGLIVHKKDGMVIGELGGKGEPNEEGIVEIGYGIVAEYQGHGYATEMVHAFSNWLLNRPEVTKVTAECLETNVASVRVLEKLGFSLTNMKNGMIYWELRKK